MIENLYKCSKCKIDKYKECFSWIVRHNRNKTEPTRHSRCKQCVNEYSKLHKQCNPNSHKIRTAQRLSPSLPIEQRLSNLFSDRLGTYNTTSKKDKLPDRTITVQYLIDLYNGQHGKCYYSGMEMTIPTTAIGRGNATITDISVDRIVPIRGYTIDNIALCCNLVNTFKQNLTAEQLSFMCMLIWKTYVLRCNIFLSARRELNNDIPNWVLRKIDLFMNKVTWRSRQRNLPIPTITRNDLAKKWMHQGNRCYYTGVLMDHAMNTQKRPYGFSASVDRVDPAKGYEPLNVVWSTWLINRMKGSLTEHSLLHMCIAVSRKLQSYGILPANNGVLPAPWSAISVI